MEFLHGRVAEKGEGQLVVALGGLGLKVFVPQRTVDSVSEGEEIHLYTALLAKEEGFELYGFASKEEREMFEALLSVPQVGPRLAFKLVSALPPGQFVAALRRGDLSALDGVKGIGRRTAQRVLLELSERALRWAPAEVPPEAEKEKIVLQALTSKALGFKAEEARRAVELVRKECPEASVEEMLRRALSILAGER